MQDSRRMSGERPRHLISSKLHMGQGGSRPKPHRYNTLNDRVRHSIVDLYCQAAEAPGWERPIRRRGDPTRTQSSQFTPDRNVYAPEKCWGTYTSVRYGARQSARVRL
ncbi:MAG: hypothetical protein K0Q46_3663 [Rhodococcus erythropolis]|jgi:hypothetical protein|nr:hypothetical protein [Rhodococcus erythropolis]